MTDLVRLRRLKLLEQELSLLNQIFSFALSLTFFSINVCQLHKMTVSGG